MRYFHPRLYNVIVQRQMFNTVGLQLGPFLRAHTVIAAVYLTPRPYTAMKYSITTLESDRRVRI